MNALIAPLTTTERDALVAAELTIQRDLKSFERVAAALVAIRDGKLYRLTAPTFADYCAERWGFSVRRAYQMIENAEAAKELAEAGIETTNEAQVAAFKSLPKESRAEVAAVAKGSGKKLTAALIESAAKIIDSEVEVEEKNESGDLEDRFDAIIAAEDAAKEHEAVCKKIAHEKLEKKLHSDFKRAVADLADLIGDGDEAVDLYPMFEDSLWLFNEVMGSAFEKHPGEIRKMLEKLRDRLTIKLAKGK